MAEKKKERKEKAEKPLEDRTIKELREEAMKVGEIHGVSAMNKEELLSALRKAKGLPEPERKRKAGVREVKAGVRDLKSKRDEERAQGATRARLNILRKKIAKLKKQTKPS